MIVVMVLVFAGILGLAMLVSGGFDQRNRRRLQQLSAGLDGEPDTTSSFLIARGGQRVKFWRARRPVGKTSVPWTEIDVEIPRVYPLAMYVRRQRRSDAGPIERGETIDVQLGDGVFDAAFLVEAAPEAVIVKLLDQDVRTFLLAQDTVELMTKDRGGVRVLQLAIRGWIDDPDQAKQAIAMVVRIASRIRDAFTEAVEEVPIEQIGAPFRPMPDDHPQRLVEASHHSEVNAVEALHARRLANERMIATLIFGAVIAAMAAFVLALS